MRNAFIFLFCLSGLTIWAHKGKEHSSGKGSMEAKSSQLKKADALYLKKIKPIFRSKCFDCHGKLNKMPWYGKLPGVKQLIENDIREAKKHLDMTHDFPFKGHGSPAEDLEEIKEVIDKGTMPPWRYRIMHKNSALTNEEKNAVHDWIEKSVKLLKN